MIKRILFFTILCTFIFTCSKNTNHVPDYSNAIADSKRLLDSLITDGKVPGIDAAVAIDGEIVWSEAFGYADLEHQIPVIKGITRFRIGSVSKPFTSAALGKLMDLNKIDLDKPIQTYVPYFPVKKYLITTRQVGGHLAGIRHYNGDEFLLNEQFDSVKEGLSIFMDDTLLFEPNSQIRYSSYGFNLLSAAIEGASGEEFLAFMQKEVFAPLDMNSTCADRKDSIIVNRTSFYAVDSLNNYINAPSVNNSYKWAGGGFLSTTTDLIKFGNAHMNPGFLSEKTLQELKTPQILDNGDTTDYGIGWFCSFDSKSFGHPGGSIGGITTYRIYAEERLITVLLSNSSNTSYGNIVDRIEKMFIEAKNN